MTYRDWLEREDQQQKEENFRKRLEANRRRNDADLYHDVGRAIAFHYAQNNGMRYDGGEYRGPDIGFPEDV